MLYIDVDVTGSVNEKRKYFMYYYVASWRHDSNLWDHRSKRHSANSKPQIITLSDEVTSSPCSKNAA